MRPLVGPVKTSPAGVHHGVHPRSLSVPFGDLAGPASGCQTSPVTLGTSLKMSVENMAPLW